MRSSVGDAGDSEDVPVCGQPCGSFSLLPSTPRQLVRVPQFSSPFAPAPARPGSARIQGLAPPSFVSPTKVSVLYRTSEDVTPCIMPVSAQKGPSSFLCGRAGMGEPQVVQKCQFTLS
jgi:hypothetical protein